MTAFGHHTQIPGSQKHLLEVTKLCKFIPGTQWTLLECWLLYLFLPWSAKTVLSEDFQQEMASSVFQKTHTYLMKLPVIEKGKMHQCVFPSGWRLQVYQICLEKMLILFKAPSFRFRKTFPYRFRAVQMHTWIILHHSLRKELREECSMSASATPIVTRNGQNCTLRGLYSINKQVPVLSDTTNN